MATQPDIWLANLDQYRARVDNYTESTRRATAEDLQRYADQVRAMAAQENVQRAIHEAMIAQYNAREAQAMQRNIYIDSLNEAEEAAAKATEPTNPVPKGWERKMIR